VHYEKSRFFNKSSWEYSVNNARFVEGWSPTNDRFSMQTFCGGLMAAFPNRATVESDFTAIGRERMSADMILINIRKRYF
jgi:hypothetical protein